MFCAAGMKGPVSEIVEQYEEEHGVAVQLQYAGSGTLLSSLSVGGGDVYLAADASYVQTAKEKGQVAEVVPVARMRAGLGVPAGNPLGLSRLDDLKRDDLRVGLANPAMSSVGKFTQEVLIRHGVWDEVEPTVLLPTVNDLMNALKLGTVDAVVCWDALAEQYDEIDFVNLPEFDAEKKKVTVGVLTTSTQPREALRFCRYLAAKDRGLPVFKAYGYDVVAGDAWSLRPEFSKGARP